tara:strand:- start:6617 stop:7219 length:603 start_codon:yes stop_codon:yes gene_type:complete
MIKKSFIILSVFILILACSKSENNINNTIVEEVFIQDYSCVSYDDLMNPQTTDRDNLEQYWNKFVEDVKCSGGGGADWGERTKFLNVFFEYADISQTISGITPSHLAYSSFVGYCNDERVNIGVLYDGWSDLNLIQRLWVMYHEFGHDVYKYEHSTDPADIMYPSSTRSDIDLNDFIRAKDRMFRRSFPGIRYISCPQTD